VNNHDGIPRIPDPVEETIHAASAYAFYDMAHPRWRPVINPETGQPMRDALGNPILERVPWYERFALILSYRAALAAKWGLATVAVMFVTMIIAMLVKKAGFEDLSTAIALLEYAWIGIGGMGVGYAVLFAKPKRRR